MVRRVVSPVFVGRRDELERVIDALARAAQGGPTFILVAGDAGVGKTRFVEEVANRALTLGGRALSGGCVQMGGDTVPYAPIVEALRRLADDASPADLARFIGSDPSDLATLVPAFARTLASTGADVEPGSRSTQGRLLEALLGLFRRLASERPLLLIVEDIHWADASTIALLGYLARNLSGAIVLVATYRSDELHRRHPLLPFLAEAERQRRTDRIALRPFDRPEVAELVRAIRSVPSDRDLVEVLFERSDGNAFYVEELLAANATASELPGTLREVLSARIAALSEPTQDLLREASAAGPDIPASLLASVAQRDEEAVHAQLREAVEHHILTTHPETGRLMFRHALMRESIYESLLPWERTRLHAAFAAAIEATSSVEDDPSRAAELAYHWSAAHDLPRALETAIRAGNAFDRVLAPDDAHRQYERALELWSQVPDAARLTGLERSELLERAAAAASSKDPIRATALIRAAIALPDLAGDPVRSGRLWELLGRYLWASGDGPAGIDACRRALELVPGDAPPVERARMLATLGRVLMNTGRFREAKPVLEEAAALAVAAGEGALEGHALNSLGVVIAYLGNVDSGRQHLATSRAIALRLTNVEEVARADANAIDLLIHVAGRFREAAGLARDAFTYVEQRHLASFFGVYDLSEGAGALIRAGRWEEADDLLGRARGYVSSGVPEIFVNERLALLEVGRGMHEAATERIELLRRLIGGSTDPQWTLPLVELTAELALWQRRPQDARREIAEVLDLLGAIDAGNISRIGPVIGLALRAEADLAIQARGDRGEAALNVIRTNVDQYLGVIRTMHGEILRERPSQVPLATAYAALSEAEVSRFEGASAGTWSTAAAAFAAVSMPYQEAYCLWRLAESLLSGREQRSAAAAAIVEAYRIAAGLGAEPLLLEIEATARRARIHLGAGHPEAAPAPSAAAALGLTARELEVLDLLVAGRTNREIGARLFIAENTAGVHVSNILGKLGVSRRMEAAAMAHRLRLIDPVTAERRPLP